MLKLKDNVELKELEKFGFEKYINDDGYFLDFSTYDKWKEYSYFEITKEKIVCVDHIVRWHFQQASELLFDLMQAGLVEKVED